MCNGSMNRAQILIFIISNKAMILSEQLTCGVWKVHRHQQLIYYLDIYHLIQNTLPIKRTFKKCRYCKGYPFNVHAQKQQNRSRLCELCYSINQHDMQFQGYDQIVQHDWYDDLSYCFPLSHKKELEVIVMVAIDPWLGEDQLQFIFQALTGCLGQHFKFAFVVALDTVLGVIILEGEEPQLVIITQDLNPKQIINSKATYLSEQHLEQLKEIIFTIRKEQKVSTILNSVNTIQRLLRLYSQYSPLTSCFLVWITRIPPLFQPHPQSSIYTIGIFICEKVPQNLETLLNIKINLNQAYFLQGEDTPTQLYYKLYQILGNQSNYFHKNSPVIKSSIKYSGTLKTPLLGIVPQRQLLQIATKEDQPHNLQLSLQYFDIENKKWFVLVVNISDRGAYRCQPFEKGTLATKTLQFLMQEYKHRFHGQKQSKSPFNYLNISAIIQQYAAYPANMTNYMQGLLNHVKNYFKQFQKYPLKLYSAINSKGKIDIIGIFWPFLIRQHTLHFTHSHHTLSRNQDSQQHIKVLNQLLGRFYVPQTNKLDFFYRMCIQNGTVTPFSINL